MMRLSQSLDKFVMTAMNALLLAAFPVSVVMFAAPSL
jgi:hypothetical protein